MKKILFTLGITLLCIVSNAQTPYYYYYEGKKQYLSLNTEHAFLSVKEQKHINVKQFNVKIAELQSDKSENKQYQKRKGINRFWTELSFEEKLSDEQYLQRLDNIKYENNTAIVSPYFRMGSDDKIGLSNFFYVKLKAESDTTLLMQMAEQEKCTIIEQDQFMPLWFVLSITEETKLNAMETANVFYESGHFAAAEPNLMPSKILATNDTYYSHQWGLENTGQNGGISGIDINVVNAWKITIGNNIKVAIIDEGVDLTHPDLAGNIHSQSYDTQNRTSPSIIRGNHGTTCAGIIGAIQNNGQGISGVAPNCTLVSISRELSNITNLLNVQRDLAAGINWAWQNGADVISNSWGSNALQGLYITDAINNATAQGRNEKGCVVVFSSGNNNASSVNYPASLPNVIAVGAVDRCGIRSGRIDSIPNSCDPWCETCQPGSAYGSELDVVAPGTNIYTTDRQGSEGYVNGDYYNGFGGTSAACPYVAGVAALILSVRPDLRSDQVQQAIESTCTKINPTIYPYSNNSNHPNGTWNTQVGHGLVNAYAALLSVLPPPTISGPLQICNQAAYTIDNLPPGATVNWRTSLHLSIVSGQGTPQVVIKKLNNTINATVYADITLNGNTFTISKTRIQLGTKVLAILLCPAADFPTFSTHVQFGYTNEDYYLVAHGTKISNNDADYRWRFYSSEPYELPVLGTGRQIEFSKRTPGDYTVSLQYNGECGWSDETFRTVRFEQSFSMNLYPNPAGELLTVELAAEEETEGGTISLLRSTGSTLAPYTIQLWHELQGLVRTVESTELTTQVSLQGLSSGMYFVHIIMNGETVNRQIIWKK